MKKFKLLCGFIMISILCVACSPKVKDTESTNQNVNGEVAEQGNTVQEETVQEEVAEEITAEVPEEKEEEITAEAPEETKENEVEQQDAMAFTNDFDEHDAVLMQKADGWSNGSVFDCTWRGKNVSFTDGIMTLKIDLDNENASPKWSGGEYRTNQFYHYGKYEVRMKPIKNDGVVSSFFTYTGPSDNNPWDEIDIEFLGKDTTKIQFNYYTNGVGDHEFMYDLGFDASEDFHEYGFEWLEDSITWYVDGVAVHTADQDIPSTPGKIMMNVWPGTGVDGWLKAFDGNVPLEAQYDWIRYTE